MTTHLDVFYPGLVRSVFGCRGEKIEIEFGTKVGETLKLPTAKHSTAFASGLCRVGGHVRLLSMKCVNNRDIFQ